VLLYELLTGTTPFDSKELMSKGFAEMMRIIREVEPHKPSTRLTSLGDCGARTAEQRHISDVKKLGAIIRGDLDWIVMKCLEKDRTRRYETANGLAADIGRHLKDEAVMAGAPTAGYRLRKFVKRNRVRVIAAGIVAGALVLGVAGTTGGMIWALSEKSKATLAAQSEAAAKVQAQENEKKAIAEAKRSQTISEFVTTALTAGDARGSGWEGGTERAGPNMTILAAMDSALKDLDSGRFADDPGTEAGLRTTIGAILRNNGKYDKARPLLEQALKIRERLCKADDPIVADSLGNLGDLYVRLGHYAEAEPLFTRALAIHEKTLGPNNFRVAESLHNLAALYRRQRHYAEAEPLFTRALAIFEEVYGPEHAQVANTLNSLAVLHADQGHYAQAEPLYTRALAMREKVLTPDHPELAQSLSNLANLYSTDPGRSAQAEPLYTRALAIREKALGPDHPEVAESLFNLGHLYCALGNHRRGEALYTRALAIWERALGSDHPNTLLIKNNLAALYWSQGKLDQSIPMFEEVLKRREATLGRQHPDTLMTLANLGVNYKDSSLLTQAIPLLEEAYRASKQHPELGFAGAALLEVYTKAGDPAKPESIARVTRMMQEMLSDARATLPKDSPELAAALAQFGPLLLTLEAWDEAEPLMRECLAIREKAQPDAWTTFNTRSMLGGALLGHNNLAEAEPQLLEGYRGLKEREAAIPVQGKVRIHETLERLVRLYEAKGDETEAAAWRSKLEAARAEQGKPEAKGGGG
jgi:tetratricopeptide (TPR) repeat protein